MNNESISKWMELIELSCNDLQINHIDIIVDQSGSEFSLLPVLSSFEVSIQWDSLFSGLPEEVLEHDSPLLIRIDLNNGLHRQWMIELATQYSQSGQLLILCSAWPFAALASYLKNYINVEYGGQEGIFRFFDSRIFPLLFSHVLSAQQQRYFLRPAIFWSWMDRDNTPRQISGDGNLLSSREEVPLLVLSDKQLEDLMCICDVNLLLRHLTKPAELKMNQEQLFLFCYEGMITATNRGLLMDDERDEFVTNLLSIAS